MKKKIIIYFFFHPLTLDLNNLVNQLIKKFWSYHTSYISPSSYKASLQHFRNFSLSDRIPDKNDRVSPLEPVQTDDLGPSFPSQVYTETENQTVI